jgi:hypothetical protein
MTWRIRGTYFESCNCDPICLVAVRPVEIEVDRGVCGYGSTFDYAG